MTVTDDTLTVADELRINIGATVDPVQRRLIANWARAWDAVAEQWERAVDDIAQITAAGGTPTQHQILALDRARNALAATIREIDEIAADLNVRVTPAAQRIVNATARSTAAQIATQWPVEINAARFDLVSPDALRAIVHRTTVQVTAASNELAPHVYQRVVNELIRAVPAGLSPRDAAARMVDGVEGAFHGGLPRALTIARTELLDASRHAAYQQQAANTDVLAGWVWMAHLDSSTCPACLVMHGTQHGLTEPGPQGHPNCRCARTPLTKPWTELGFDIPEPDTQMPTGPEWFATQPDQVRLAIMGPQRLALLDSGAVPFADLATVRHNRAWRDSIVPTPVSVLAA